MGPVAAGPSPGSTPPVYIKSKNADSNVEGEIEGREDGFDSMNRMYQEGTGLKMRGGKNC